MRADPWPGLLIIALLAAACAHGETAGSPLKAESLGRHGAVLSRALSRVQAMGYTVTVVDAGGSRFRAEHSSTTLASLFGSDSNCEMDVHTNPAARPDTSRIVITWRARNPGSLAGCRKDAETLLRAATGEARPAKKRPEPPPFDPLKGLPGGTFGEY